MAQETKVGLLAGLAFIICFAVILTNRGRDQLVPASAQPPGTSQPDQSASTPPADNARSVTADTRQWNNTQNTNSRRSATAGKTNGPSGAHPSGGRQNSGAGPGDSGKRAGGQLPSTAPSESKVANGESPDDARWRQVESKIDQLAAQLERGSRDATSKVSGKPDGGRQAAAGNYPSQQGHPSNVIPGGPDHRQAATKPTRLTAAGATGQSSKERRRDEPRDSVPAQAKGDRYTVASGDTLTGIAKRFYGSSSKSVIDAIFDANRAVLPSADDLRSGLDIILPAIPESASVPSRKPRTAQASADAQRRSKSRERSTVDEARWYRIQKNDTYIKIARSQLGEEARWQEIFELNKDKFPKASMIREGVRIRLPDAAGQGNGTTDTRRAGL
ncbi:MAG: LysM peptidoglycan-binding domain-containing protein [Planctomycetota bacterium]|jgi:phage tail protein X